MNTISENTLLDQRAMEKHYRTKTRFSKYFNQFDATLATKIGLNEAIFIQKLHQLTSHKKNVKVRDGFHWYYNTFDTWQREFFPFMTRSAIRTAVDTLRGKRLIKDGDRRLTIKDPSLPVLLITSEDFNEANEQKKGYRDHTLWYRIDYLELHKLIQKNNESNQVKGAAGQQPMGAAGQQPMGAAGQQSNTTMNPTKNPPLGNRGGVSINSNHEDSVANDGTDSTFLSRGDSSEAVRRSGSVEEGRLYGPLTQAEIYELTKDHFVSPEDVVALSEEVIDMFHSGALKVIKNTKETTKDFLVARIKKGTIAVDTSEEMLMAIESEHPLQVARDKCVLLEMKLRSVDQDGKSLRKQYEECGDQKILLKINALKNDFMKLKPKWKQAISEYVSLSEVYPDRFAKLTSQ